MVLIWTGLALIAIVLFLVAVVWWDRTTGPSDDVDVTPSQPPADPGAEGMKVAEPGQITTGSEQDSDSSDR